MAEKWEPRNSRNIGTQLNELLKLHCNCSSTLAILTRYAGKEGTGPCTHETVTLYGVYMTGTISGRSDSV